MLAEKENPAIAAHKADAEIRKILKHFDAVEAQTIMMILTTELAVLLGQKREEFLLASGASYDLLKSRIQADKWYKQRC